jgi:hypothetical protein
MWEDEIWYDLRDAQCVGINESEHSPFDRNDNDEYHGVQDGD